jgi:hypothetical protein
MNIQFRHSIFVEALLVVALTLVACGSGDEPTADPPPPATPVPPTSTPDTPTTPTQETGSTPESLTMTTTDTPVPGSTNGTFTVGEGSEATFTVNEKLSSLPLPNDAVMRTGKITGEIDLSAATASLVIDLHSLKSDSTRRDRYIKNRLFPSQPNAKIEVNEFPDIPEEFAEGKSFTSTVIATVNVNGTAADIEFEIESRLDPDRLLVLVKGDFTWADFGMSAPTSRSFVVKDDVHVEVLVSAVPK